MCYNKSCKIKICSRIDGETTVSDTQGTIIKTASEVRFDYVLDGDECVFTVNGSQAVQSRRGAQNITMTFRKGKETECLLESGGFSGSFTLFTHNLICEETDGKFKLTIIYTLGEEEIELSFSAEYKNAKVKK